MKYKFRITVVMLSALLQIIISPSYGKQASTRSYTVDSVTYYPVKYKKYIEIGIASWYGDKEHKNTTASGETFSKHKLTAAHKFLPIPSIVKITNLSNNVSIKVRVNDRGPFIKGRIIDLSEKAATLLGFREDGITKVKIELLKW